MLGELPDPVLRDLFCFLPLPCLKNVSLACCRFLAVWSDSWVALKVDFSKNIPAKILSSFKRRFPNINELVLVSTKLEDGLDILMGAEWTLRSVTSDFRVDSVSFEPFFRSSCCSVLEHLTLSDASSWSRRSEHYDPILSEIPRTLTRFILKTKQPLPLDFLKRHLLSRCPLEHLEVLNIRQPISFGLPEWMGFLRELLPQIPSLRFLRGLRAITAQTALAIARLKEPLVVAFLEAHPSFSMLFKRWGWHSFGKCNNFDCSSFKTVADVALARDLARAAESRDTLLYAGCIDALKRLVLKGDFTPSEAAIAARAKAIDVACATLPSLVVPHSQWEHPRRLQKKTVSMLSSFFSESSHVLCSLGVIRRLERSAMLAHSLFSMIQTRSHMLPSKTDVYLNNLFSLCSIKGLQQQLQEHFLCPTDSRCASWDSRPADLSHSTAVEGEERPLFFFLMGEEPADREASREREAAFPPDSPPTKRQLATDIATALSRLGSGDSREDYPRTVLWRINWLLQLSFRQIVHSNRDSMGLLKVVTSVLLERVQSSPGVQRVFGNAVVDGFREWKKVLTRAYSTATDYLPALRLLLDSVPSESLARIGTPLILQTIRYILGDSCNWGTSQIIRFIAVLTASPKIVQFLLSKSFFSKYFRTSAVARSPAACVDMFVLALKSMEVAQSDERTLNTLSTQLREKSFSGADSFYSHCSVVGKAAEVLAAMQRHHKLGARDRKLVVADKALFLLHNLYNPPPPETGPQKRGQPKMPSLSTALSPNGAYASEAEFVGAVLRSTAELLFGGTVPLGQRNKYCLAVLLAINSVGGVLPEHDATAAMRLLDRAAIQEFVFSSLPTDLRSRVQNGMLLLLLSLDNDGVAESKIPAKSAPKAEAPVEEAATQESRPRVPALSVGLARLTRPTTASSARSVRNNNNNKANRSSSSRRPSVDFVARGSRMTPKPRPKLRKGAMPLTVEALAKIEKRWQKWQT